MDTDSCFSDSEVPSTKLRLRTYRTLMELNSVLVCIPKINGVKGNQIYGEVKAIDDDETIYFFNEGKQSAKSISADGTLPLNGPTRCIVSPDSIFAVSLKEKNLDLEVCEGYFYMPTYHDTYAYEDHLRVIIRGKNGYAMLHFSVVLDGVQATVDVAFQLNKGVVLRPHAVHGKILALYRPNEYEHNFKRKFCQTVLFSAPEDEPKLLQQEAQDQDSTMLGFSEPKFKIPLSRSVVAVPTFKSLFLKTSLGISFPENTPTEILSLEGTPSFPSQRGDNETHTQYIDCKYGRIEVKVSWLEEVRD